MEREKHAIVLCQDLKTACAKGGFNLTKWMSNSRAVLTSFSKEERDKAIKDLDLDTDNLPTGRVLEVQ